MHQVLLDFETDRKSLDQQRESSSLLEKRSILLGCKCQTKYAKQKHLHLHERRVLPIRHACPSNRNLRQTVGLDRWRCRGQAGHAAVPT